MDALDLIKAYEIFRSHEIEIQGFKKQPGSKSSFDLNPNPKVRLHGHDTGIDIKSGSSLEGDVAKQKKTSYVKLHR